jgi:hypothetical protein
MRLLDSSFFNLIKMLVGTSEVIEQDHSLNDKKMNRTSRVVVYYGLATQMVGNLVSMFYRTFSFTGPTRHHHHHNNALLIFLKNIEKRIELFLDSFNQSRSLKHTLCTHRYNCAIYSLVGFFQRFIAGFVLQALFKCFSSIGSLIKNPVKLLKILKNPDNVGLGLFLGSYVAIFRFLSCLLKWVTNKNSKLHGLISGFFAGWSMMFYKSSSIALYLNFKLLEVKIFFITKIFSNSQIL